MSEQRKKQTLGELLNAGERPFVEREKFRENRLAISEHSERVLRNLPLPAAPGRPRKDQVVCDTDAVTIRMPIQTIELATRQADEMGISRNRWFNIAARRQIQDPVTEAELKPAMASNIVMFHGCDVPMTEAATASGLSRCQRANISKLDQPSRKKRLQIGSCNVQVGAPFLPVGPG